LSRWQRLRSFFPVAEDAIFLDHAGGAAISSRVDEAVRKASDEASRRVGRERAERRAHTLERVRGRVAELLGGEPREIAFAPHADAALARIADDVAWQAGDRIVSCQGGLAPGWRRLRERRVDLLRVVPGREGPTAAQLDEALLHPRARMLFLAAVDPVSGARAPLAPIGEACRERGVLLCVDASHGLGALAVDAPSSGIDYLVCDAHRCLMGLPGCALLYRNARLADDAADARDLEPGVLDPLGVAALGAAVDLLLEVGPREIEARVLGLVERLARGLEARGVEVTSPRGPAASNLLGFRLAGEPPGRTRERLAEGRIHVGETPAGVRVSPHFYNEEGEIDALLEAL
jgi:selenocysteine lyase/cysteine desulfurase